MTGTTVVRNDDERRYEAWLDGRLAGFATFRRLPRAVAFIHTQVDDAYEGQGVGSVLARSALDEVRSEGLLVRPYCPFIRAWIESHPDYQELVDPTWTPPSS